MENVIALAAEAAHDGMERQTRRFLAVADQVNDQLALSWASGRLDLSDDAGASRLMRDIVDVAPEGALSSVGLGFPDGRFVGLIADPARWPDTDWRYSFSSRATGGLLTYYEDDAGRTVGRELARAGEYDPRARPWYVAALAADGPVWTDVYTDFGTRTPTLSRAVAIRDETGEVVAVALTDLFVRHVQRFLETLPMSTGSEVFVTLPDRRVLAAWSPAAASPTRAVTDALAIPAAPGAPALGAGMPASLRRTGETVALLQSPDDVIEAQGGGSGALDARVLPEVAATGASHVELGGEPGFLLSTRLDDGVTPDWTLGAFVPERDYLESVPAILRRVIPLALLILVAGLATIAGFSAFVSRPLARLGDSARRIADGDFDAPVMVRVDNEVGRLAGAIDGMRRRLGASFASLEAERERSAATLDAIGDAVIMTREDGAVALLNRAAETLTGWKDADARGRPVHEVVRARDGHRDRPLDRAALLDAMAGPSEPGLALSLRDGEGRVRPVRCIVSPLGRAGGPRGAVLVLADLTDAERLKSELAWAASHDALTGLANRTEFERRAARALGEAVARARAAPDEAPVHAIAWLDIDGFREVNETIGHVGGDELLRQVAATLEASTLDGTTVARFAGDEFVLLFEHRARDEVLADIEAARDALVDRPFTLDGRGFGVGAAFGLVTLDASTGSVGAALQDAQRACADAREAGANRVRVHVDGAVRARQRREESSSLGRLDAALAENRLELHAQRVVPAAPGAAGPADVEILVRLRETDGTLSSPDAFMPAAERYGVAARVDRVVIERCFEALAAHPALYDAVGALWLNLSGQSVGDAGFLDWVESAFERHGVPHGRIGFELTETAAITHLSDAERTMRALRALGCRFALDDFGTGTSAFHHLRTLPVDVLKIDGGFVARLLGDARDRALVASIHSLAWSFGLTTVAEGVEDEATLAELRTIGIDRLQGFLLDRPRPLLDLLDETRSGP